MPYFQAQKEQQFLRQSCCSKIRKRGGHKHPHNSHREKFDTIRKDLSGGNLIRYEKIYLGRILQVFAQKNNGGGGHHAD